MRKGNLSNSKLLEVVNDGNEKYYIYGEKVEEDIYLTYRPEPGYIYSCTYINNPLKDQVALTYASPILLKEVENILILGAGAGENIRQLKAINEKYKITAVDIEKTAYKIAKKYFSIDNYNDIQYYIEDAERFINHNENKYDCIIMDIYKGNILPTKFITHDFFKKIYQQLSEEGMFFVNTNFTGRFEDVEENKNILSDIHKTLYTVGFKTIFRNEMNNMGIHYIFKEEMDLKTFRNKLYDIYASQNNCDIKASIGGIILSTYHYKHYIDTAEIIYNNKIINESKKKFYTKRILDISRYYIKNKRKIIAGSTIKDISLKYLYNQMNMRDNIHDVNDIWFDLLNISDENYYKEIENHIYNIAYNIDEIIRFLLLPNAIPEILINKNENKYNLFIKYYINIIQKIKNDQGREAIPIMDKMFELLKNEFASFFSYTIS